jgi:3D (Asp-Asp-Asp) domain-containing protein
MNNQRICFLLLAAATIPLGACSLSDVGHQYTGIALKIGKKYEVRKALNPADVFNPQQLQGICFVLRPQAAPAIAMKGDSLAVRTTAYTHSEDDHLCYGSLNAVGTPLKYGAVRSAAADWSRYPLGTRFRIKGQPAVTYVVDDYGSALVGTNTIDIYCTSRNMMNNWGVRNLNIEVVRWGSYEDSLEIMSDRVIYPHVRRMVQDIRARQSAQASTRSMTTPTTAMTAPMMLMRDG